MISLAAKEEAKAKPVLKAFMQDLSLMLVKADLRRLGLSNPGYAFLPRCNLPKALAIAMTDKRDLAEAMLLLRSTAYPAGIILAKTLDGLIDTLRQLAPSVVYYKIDVDDFNSFTDERVTLANPLFQKTDEEFLLLAEMKHGKEEERHQP